MYIFVKFHGKLMSEQPVNDNQEAPQISVVTIQTPGGQKQIPIPATANKLMQDYNIEFALSQRLGDSVIAIQEAKTRSENRAQSMLLELMSLSNQTSLELGKIARDKELAEELAKAEAEAKKKVKDKETKDEKTSEKPSKPPAKKKEDKSKKK